MLRMKRILHNFFCLTNQNISDRKICLRQETLGLTKGPRDLRKYKISRDYWKNWPLLKLFDLVKVVRNIDISILEHKKIKCFFANVFWHHISCSNVFHKHDIYNFIYMNIHMENTFKAIQCQKCRKHFKKKW